MALTGVVALIDWDLAKQNASAASQCSTYTHQSIQAKKTPKGSEASAQPYRGPIRKKKGANWVQLGGTLARHCSQH